MVTVSVFVNRVGDPKKLRTLCFSSIRELRFLLQISEADPIFSAPVDISSTSQLTRITGIDQICDGFRVGSRHLWDSVSSPASASASKLGRGDSVGTIRSPSSPNNGQIYRRSNTESGKLSIKLNKSGTPTPQRSSSTRSFRSLSVHARPKTDPGSNSPNRHPLIDATTPGSTGSPNIRYSSHHFHFQQNSPMPSTPVLDISKIEQSPNLDVHADDEDPLADDHLLKPLDSPWSDPGLHADSGINPFGSPDRSGIEMTTPEPIEAGVSDAARSDDGDCDSLPLSDDRQAVVIIQSAPNSKKKHTKESIVSCLGVCQFWISWCWRSMMQSVGKVDISDVFSSFSPKTPSEYLRDTFKITYLGSIPYYGSGFFLVTSIAGSSSHSPNHDPGRTAHDGLYFFFHRWESIPGEQGFGLKYHRRLHVHASSYRRNDDEDEDDRNDGTGRDRAGTRPRISLKLIHEEHDDVILVFNSGIYLIIDGIIGEIRRRDTLVDDLISSASYQPESLLLAVTCAYTGTMKIFHHNVQECRFEPKYDIRSPSESLVHSCWIHPDCFATFSCEGAAQLWEKRSKPLDRNKQGTVESFECIRNFNSTSISDDAFVVDMKSVGDRLIVLCTNRVLYEWEISKRKLARSLFVGNGEPICLFVGTLGGIQTILVGFQSGTWRMWDYASFAKLDARLSAHDRPIAGFLALQNMVLSWSESLESKIWRW